MSILPPGVREGVVWLWYNVLLPLGRMACNLSLAGAVKMLVNQLVGAIVRQLLGQIAATLMASLAPLLEPYSSSSPQTCPACSPSPSQHRPG